MRPVRIVLVFIALIAVGLAGWALGGRGGYGQPGADPAIAEAPSAPDDQTAQDDVTGGGKALSVNTPSGGTPKPPVTRPPKVVIERPAKPVIESISTVPHAPFSGGYLHLDPGPNEVTFRIKIRNATRAQFWIAPADAKGDIKPVWLGEDRNGRNGWTTRLWYNSQPLFEQVLVQAIGPGGRAQATFGVTSEAGEDALIEEEGTQEVTENPSDSEGPSASKDQDTSENQTP